MIVTIVHYKMSKNYFQNKFILKTMLITLINFNNYWYYKKFLFNWDITINLHQSNQKMHQFPPMSKYYKNTSINYPNIRTTRESVKNTTSTHQN
jgi:hypothetical protein